MTEPFPPSLIRAWQYSSAKGGLEKNLKLNASVPLPTPKPNQNLIQVIAAALNPVDHKPHEIPVVGRFLVRKPATPGLDFAGCIVTPATDSSFKRGQLVFGVANISPFAGGALSEFILTGKGTTVAVPDGVNPVDAATIGIAGLTAYQSIVPNVKKGDKVFINGGSGGCGVFGLQIAKAVGCHVTTSCSTANVEFCKSLGAEEVVDYKKGSVIEALKASGQKFDLVVDNVGGNRELYRRCHEYTQPGAKYVLVGWDPSSMFSVELFKLRRMPSFLGGGKRTYVEFFAKTKVDDLEQIGKLMREGSVRAVIDQKFPFEQAPQAFEKLKTGRSKGKIVVDVASETYKTSSE